MKPSRGSRAAVVFPIVLLVLAVSMLSLRAEEGKCFSSSTPDEVSSEDIKGATGILEALLPKFKRFFAAIRKGIEIGEEAVEKAFPLGKPGESYISVKAAEDCLSAADEYFKSLNTKLLVSSGPSLDSLAGKGCEEHRATIERIIADEQRRIDKTEAVLAKLRRFKEGRDLLEQVTRSLIDSMDGVPRWPGLDATFIELVSFQSYTLHGGEGNPTDVIRRLATNVGKYKENIASYESSSKMYAKCDDKAGDKDVDAILDDALSGTKEDDPKALDRFEFVLATELSSNAEFDKRMESLTRTLAKAPESPATGGPADYLKLIGSLASLAKWNRNRVALGCAEAMLDGFATTQECMNLAKSSTSLQGKQTAAAGPAKRMTFCWVWMAGSKELAGGNERGTTRYCSCRSAVTNITTEDGSTVRGCFEYDYDQYRP